VTHYVSTIKKITGLVILTAFFLSPAFAEAANYGFTLSPNIGILYGHSEEIVYKDPPYQNFYLSELLWDLKPLVYVGLVADYGPLDRSVTRGFTAALSFKAGLPLRTGILENRDWLNRDKDFVTWYSRHDTYSRTAVLLDASAGYLWRFAGSLAFSAYGELSFMHFSWSGKDGYRQYTLETSDGYPPWDSGLPKSYYTGEVIQYRQNWFVLSPGVSLNWDMNRLFSMKAFFNYSPLIYCAARDDHLVLGTTFFDYPYFGHYLKSGGGFVLSASTNTSLSLFLSYNYITGPRGDTFQGGKRVAEDGAGAAYSSMDLGLAVKLRLK